VELRVEVVIERREQGRTSAPARNPSVVSSTRRGSVSAPGQDDDSERSGEGETATSRSNGGKAGSPATLISNAMSRFHRDYYGRGPDTVRTVIGRDHVITFLEGTHTPVERTLLDAGESEAVIETRLAFQRAMKSKFVDCVEEATGRKVRAFLSQVSMDPDISAEIFVLESNGRNGEEIDSA
jgi:uncharacterized protein YbcI